MPSSSTQEYSRTLEPTFRLSTSAVCRSLCHVSAQELDSLAGFEAGCCAGASELGLWWCFRRLCRQGLLSFHSMGSQKHLSQLGT